MLLGTARVKPKPESNNLETESRLRKRRLFFRQVSAQEEEKMTTHPKQPKNSMPATESSPWTEPFQRAQDVAAKNSEAANQPKTAPKPADRAAPRKRDSPLLRHRPKRLHVAQRPHPQAAHLDQDE